MNAKKRWRYMLRKRRGLVTALSLCLVTAIVIGVIYRSVRQECVDQALLAAVQNKDVVAVRLLLSRGANPSVHNVYQRTPHTPAETIQWVTKSRESVSQNSIVLSEAALGGNVQIVECLLDRGAGINDAGLDDWTALMWATVSSRRDVVRLLLKRGARVNARNVTGATAMTLAEKTGNADIVNILKSAGAML
jgi:ankyrin repeat protein